MKSLAELQAIRDKARAQISVREGQEDGIRIWWVWLLAELPPVHARF